MVPKVYDGTTAAIVLTRSLNGVLSGDTVVLSGGSASYADPFVGDGKVVILTGMSLSGAQAGKYTLIGVVPTSADILGILTLNVSGPGTILKLPDLSAYHYGTVITLTAVPGDGYVLSGWSGDITGSSNPTFVTMTANKTVTATFVPMTYLVSVQAGAHGTVTPGSGTVTYNTSPSYEIRPETGYMIDTVVVDGASVQVTDGFRHTVTFAHVMSPHTIVATFRAIPDTQGPTITWPQFGTLPGIFGWTDGSFQAFTVRTSPYLLSFTLDDNRGSSTWTLTVNGVVVASGSSTGNIVYPVQLTEGRNDVEARASDGVGNLTVRNLIITLDSVGPVITINPSLPASTTASVLRIEGSVYDALSGFKSLFINGKQVVPYLDGSFNETLVLVKGNNTISIEAQDNVGNRTSTSYVITYAPPTPPPPSIRTLTLTIGKLVMDVDGKKVTLEAAPVIRESRTVLPIRAIAEAINASVAWDPVTRKVTITRGSTKIELWIGKSTAKLNGKSTSIDAANSKVVPYITNGRTMLPVRFIAEMLGLGVQWNASTQVVTLTLQP